MDYLASSYTAWQYCKKIKTKSKTAVRTYKNTLNLTAYFDII